MRRRAVLAGAAGLAATAGCLSIPESEERHPFAGETVTVRVDENSDTPHDLQANATETLQFWETNSEQYAGFEVEFELVESGEPDMVIAYADSPQGCEDVPGYSENVLGCAPVLGPNTSVPEPVVARVVAGARPFGEVTTTAKHEVGHVLGLGHGDDPGEIMSNRPEDRIPMYGLRVDIWETVLAGAERTNEASSLYTAAIELWNAEDYGAASPGFEDAREAFADAVATFEEARGMTDGFGSNALDTLDRERVQSLLSTLAGQVDLLAAAASAMAEGADAAATGEAETANARREEANDNIATFRDGGPVQVRDIGIALGLVRGFDRDDPVVDFDEDDP